MSKRSDLYDFGCEGAAGYETSCVRGCDSKYGTAHVVSESSHAEGKADKAGGGLIF